MRQRFPPNLPSSIANTRSSGFLAVNPGTNTTVSASSINWYTDGQVVACASEVGVDDGRQITLIAGGAGSTDFLIDVVGYYL